MIKTEDHPNGEYSLKWDIIRLPFHYAISSHLVAVPRAKKKASLAHFETSLL